MPKNARANRRFDPVLCTWSREFGGAPVAWLIGVENLVTEMLWLIIIALRSQALAETACEKFKDQEMYPLQCDIRAGDEPDSLYCRKYCSYELPLCHDGSAIGLVPVEGLKKLQLAIGCSLSNIDRENRYRVEYAVGKWAQTRFPIRDKYLCTEDDFKDNLLDFTDPTSIYKKLFISCKIPICARNNLMRRGEPPCFSTRAEVPRFFFEGTMEPIRYCEKYANRLVDVHECELRPVCRNDPFMLQFDYDSMPLVYVLADGVFTVDCEDLCEPGKSNHEGLFGNRPCRRILSTVEDNPINAAVPLIGWCSDEMSQLIEDPVTCNKRPFCINEEVPELGSEYNPFFSKTCIGLKQSCTPAEVQLYHCDQSTNPEFTLCDKVLSLVRDENIRLRCIPLPHCNINGEPPDSAIDNPYQAKECQDPLTDCTTLDETKIVCSGALKQTPLIICPLYDMDPNEAEKGRCTPMPLCFDEVRTQAYRGCERICEDSYLVKDRIDCRQVPAENGRDPFRIIPRIKSLPLSLSLDAFLKSYSAKLGEDMTQTTFRGRRMCSPLQSVERPNKASPKNCNPLPICDTKDSYDFFDPWFLGVESCVNPLDRCNAEELKKYYCSNKEPVKPYCEKYETDISRIGNCTQRFPCEDFSEGLLIFDEFQMLQQFYQTAQFSCETVCEVNAPKTNDETQGGDTVRTRYAHGMVRVEREAKSDLNCRLRPTRGLDYWGVAARKASRALDWCSETKSILRNAPKDCNQLPLCVDGKPPIDPVKNPYYSESRCVEMLEDCKAEQAEILHCSTTVAERSSFFLIAIGAIVALFIIIIIIGVAVFRQPKKPAVAATGSSRTTFKAARSK